MLGSIKSQPIGPIVRTVILGLILFFGTSLSFAVDSDVWLLSTRRAPVSSPLFGWEDCLDYYHLDCQNHWQKSTEATFFSKEKSTLPTTVFIHGNQTDMAWSITVGKGALDALEAVANGRPLRLVIWSWPSDRVSLRHRVDARVKASESDIQSYYLASWLDRVDPSVPVLLAGYSYGARVITGSLHMLAGGEVDGLRPQLTTVGKKRPLRALLIAAAIPNDWLQPDRRNGLTLTQLERLIYTRNSSDPVLRLFPRVEYHQRSAALGYSGPCLSRLDQTDAVLECLPMEGEVGRAHGWCDYLGSPSLRNRLGQAALFDPLHANSSAVAHPNPAPTPILTVSGH